MIYDTNSIYHEFRLLVNLSTSELKRLLDTGETKADDSKNVKMLLELLSKQKDELTTDDYLQMKRINRYIKRHLTQRPNMDTALSRWRYSLINRGHDPLK